jgi:DNA-binding MarR family transcriptional regulator
MGAMEDTFILGSQDIVEARRATSSLFRVVLAEHDTTFDQWVVLDTLATGRFPPERAQLLPGLTAALTTAPAVVEDVLDDAEAAGLVRIVSARGGEAGAVRIELTAAGEARHGALRSAIVLVVAELCAGIPERDVTTAHHVLTEVTRRADGWAQLWTATRPLEPAR